MPVNANSTGRDQTIRAVVHRAFFSLLELMVIVGVLAVLVSVLVPLLSEGLQRARSKQCADNLRRLGVSTFTYSDLYDGWFPSTYGTLSSEESRPWAHASRRSMETFIGLLGSNRDALSCPTVWHQPRKADVEDGLLWGYNKWAGTLNTAPLNVRYNYYSRYQDIRNSVRSTEPGLGHPGYLNLRRMNQALRRFIVLGSSLGTSLSWQSALQPLVVPNLGGATPIPPAEITLWGDTNKVNRRMAVSASHSRIIQQADEPIVPPQISGLSELLGDGHVQWYSLPGNSLYYVSDRSLGGAGVFVQDNR